MKKNYIVTGCAGFIGSNLTSRLLSDGNKVLGVDNFITGKKKFISPFIDDSNFQFLNLDLSKKFKYEYFNEYKDGIFHLSANADIRDGLKNTFVDINQNIIVTYNILEMMRHLSIKKIFFSSTGSVYGESSQIPTKEDAPFPVQTSLYATSKISAEGLISSFCEGFGIEGKIFRFVSILGKNYHHGHVIDFVNQLKKDKHNLHVLGNGNQKKSYLYIEDCIDAIMLTKNLKSKFEIFNLGQDYTVTVNESIKVICEELNVKPKISYSGGDRGWVGDNPLILLDISKIKKTGWYPQTSIEEAIRKTVRYLTN